MRVLGWIALVLSILVLMHIAWTGLNRGVWYDFASIRVASDLSGPPRTSIPVAEYVDLANDAKRDLTWIAIEATLASIAASAGLLFLGVTGKAVRNAEV